METINKRPIFPWYKERLQTKYLKAPNKQPSVSTRWHFLNTSLDDFSGSQSGPSPLIFQGTPHHSSSQKPRKSLSKEHACFSKQMIQKQIRREYVASVEEQLKQHPLTMYPHYKDHMTPELFDQVVSILDPDMCINSASALPAPTGDHAEVEDEENSRESSEEEVFGHKKETSATKISTDVQNPSIRNPHILQMNVNNMKKDRAVTLDPLSTHEDAKTAARCFRKWMKRDSDNNGLSGRESCHSNKQEGQLCDKSL
ncbi:uncharacterized protein zgc:158260 [Amphiprion ocellaris]|uniref:Uncharacterized protein n=1 Tax=Amphiprion ocellaris TaxID=80972 RepID=A0AAQ5YMH5_AMPOC|nr:uncharacterized protein zgc:158260 [Amphiprion ocellaris]